MHYFVRNIQKSDIILHTNTLKMSPGHKIRKKSELIQG